MFIEEPGKNKVRVPEHACFFLQCNAGGDGATKDAQSDLPFNERELSLACAFPVIIHIVDILNALYGAFVFECLCGVASPGATLFSSLMIEQYYKIRNNVLSLRISLGCQG